MAGTIKAIVAALLTAPKIEMNMLLREEAEWTKEAGDWKAAADLFVSCAEYKKAIELFG